MSNKIKVGQIVSSLSFHDYSGLNDLGRITDPRHWVNSIDDLKQKRDNASTKSAKSYWHNKMKAMFVNASNGLFNFEHHCGDKGMFNKDNVTNGLSFREMYDVLQECRGEYISRKESTSGTK